MIGAKSWLEILIGSEECGAESQVLEFTLRPAHSASVLTELAYVLNTTYAIVSARDIYLDILHHRSPFVVSDALAAYPWLHSAVHTGLSFSDKCGDKGMVNECSLIFPQFHLQFIKQPFRSNAATLLHTYVPGDRNHALPARDVMSQTRSNKQRPQLQSAMCYQYQR
jgi:hypothetical protein